MLNENQRRALEYLADGEWHGAVDFRLSGQNRGGRAEINVLQSLVRAGFAVQRHARKSDHRSAAWQISEEGRIALSLERKRAA